MRRSWIASSETPARAAAEPDIGGVGKPGDENHAERERIAEVLVMQHVAANLGIEQDGDDIEGAAGKAISGGDGAEGVGEEQQRGAEDAGPENRECYVTPVLPGAGAEDRCGLAPFALQAIEGRRQDQHHERDLEIEIGERQAPEAQQVEAGAVDVEVEELDEERRYQAHAAEGG